MKTSRSFLTALALVAACVCAAPAMAAGYEHGPAPTAALLDAAGPYPLASYKISAADAKAYNYGGATVHYPTAQGETFGIVVMMPGFLAFQAVYDGLVKKFASHGFIVANLDSVGRGDVPDVRAQAVAGGLKHVIELAQSGKAPYASVADVSRRAIVGNSMGGGAVLSASVLDPSLKAVVALQPWHTTQSFAKDTIPTLIVACQKDTIAPNKTHSDVFYASLPATLPRAEIEVKGASHLCATFLGSKAQLTTMGKSTVAWLKRFVDEDMRYDAMVKGGINEGEFSRFVVEGF
jgi:alpha-beta hydrolase superfamily lysophospholipase